MSDQFDSIFDGLRGQRPPAEFAETHAIRRRGRQRARRQVALAGVAVLAVTGVGAAAVAAGVGGPGPGLPVAAPPTGTPAPSSGNTPATSPTPAPAHELDQWLLTREDLGPGQWEANTWEPEWTEGPDQWRWEGACPGYRSEDYGSLRQRTDLLTLTWTDGPFGPSDIPRWLHVIVDLFESDAAASGNLDDIRAVIARCDAGDHLPFGSYQVTDAGFAGDDSMLVRHRVDAEGGIVDTKTVVVRVGPAVLTVFGYDPALGHGDPEFLRDMATRAADRLP